METDRPIRFWVGTYTTPAPHVPEANGGGISHGLLDPATGGLSLSLASEQTPDPSYLARHDDLLAAVSERPDAEGALHIYQIANGAALELKHILPAYGRHPCHLALIDKALCLTNYMGDRLVCYRPDDKEKWRPQQLAQYTGSGPNRDRQESPHLHQISWLKTLGLAAVCDLGSDRIWLHRIRQGTIEPTPGEALHPPLGSGPRHLVYSETTQTLYALCELSGMIEVFQYRSGKWPHLPSAAKGMKPLPEASAIRLHPTKPFLYAASRKESCIAVFALEPSGKLRERGRFDTQGRAPRDFAIDPTGQWLLAANQDSHQVVSFELDDSGFGILKYASDVGSPVNILF